ncbi:MAG TPA: hypothetical protein VF252_10175 [Gemmatimonadales bacterium]
MSNRLAELLARGKAGRLTPAETVELGRLLNAPLLGTPDHTPPKVAPARALESSDVPSRLRAVNWFARCGEPVTVELSMPLEQVPSWQAAAQRCRELNWETAQLAAQNQLSMWLHLHDRGGYARWNHLVAEHKAAMIDPLTQARWLPYQTKHGLDAKVTSSVQWNVLGALMEHSYRRSGHGCSFFLELLTLYEAGHCPCGWKGDWPGGTLLVY